MERTLTNAYYSNAHQPVWIWSVLVSNGKLNSIHPLYFSVIRWPTLYCHMSDGGFMPSSRTEYKDNLKALWCNVGNVLSIPLTSSSDKAMSRWPSGNKRHWFQYLLEQVILGNKDRFYQVFCTVIVKLPNYINILRRARSSLCMHYEWIICAGEREFILL